MAEQAQVSMEDKAEKSSSDVTEYTKPLKEEETEGKSSLANGTANSNGTTSISPLPETNDIIADPQEQQNQNVSSTSLPDVPAVTSALSFATVDSHDDLGLSGPFSANPTNSVEASNGSNHHGDSKESAAAASTKAVVSKAVDPERKAKLLLMARQDRIAWVQKASLPYKKQSIDDNDRDHPWSQDASLANLKASHIGSHLPAALDVVQQLYNHNHGGSRIGDQPISENGNNSSLAELGQFVKESLGEQLGDVTAFPSGAQLLESELEYRSNDDVLQAYNDFLRRLKDPACSATVQGMRTFCRNLQDLEDAKVLSQKLQSYITSTARSLQQSHVLWRKDRQQQQQNQQESESLEWSRRSLESFIFTRCRPHIESVLYGSAAQAKDREWQDKLSSLQFVAPQHLEINCLVSSSDELMILLAEPIKALHSVDLYASPFEKLQRVLVVYKAINKALSVALNKNRQDAENRGEAKLPSADDVLPTLILTILRARPSRLHMNVQMMEDFLPAEHLRGEAGYAFTNLYGAIQFLVDLDLAEKPDSLTMSAEEFRKGLEDCRSQAETRFKTRVTTVASAVPKCSAADNIMGISSSSSSNVDVVAQQLPVSTVRAARLNGESVDMDWAMKWWKEQGQEVPKAASSLSSTKDSVSNPLRGLPPGFTRNYNFLTSRPETVRMADLGPLLKEYRMLVKTTETLVSERDSMAWAERKLELQAKQMEVYAKAKQVDPSLLPSSPSRKK